MKTCIIGGSAKVGEVVFPPKQYMARECHDTPEQARDEYLASSWAGTAHPNGEPRVAVPTENHLEFKVVLEFSRH